MIYLYQFIMIFAYIVYQQLDSVNVVNTYRGTIVNTYLDVIN